MTWSFYDHICDLDDAISVDFSEHDLPGIGVMYRADRKFTKHTGIELDFDLQYAKEDSGTETAKMIVKRHKSLKQDSVVLRTIDITKDVNEAMKDKTEEGRDKCLVWERILRRIAKNITVLRKELADEKVNISKGRKSH